MNQKLNNRSLGESIWIGFEHEAMHLETFLYMLLQSDKVLPPPGVEFPDFLSMAQEAKKHEKPNQWFRIPKQKFKIGLGDSDINTIPEDSFGWDNEKPQRKVSVHSFESQARPVTNGEYARYLEANRLRTLPASWILLNPDDNYSIEQGISCTSPSASESYLTNFAVRTIFGPVSLALAQDWPLMASFDELASYAKWMECRIPTFEEVKSIYAYADSLKKDPKSLYSNNRLVTTLLLMI